MPTAQNNQLGLIEKGRALHKAVSFDRYLKQLVSVYTSPFLKPKYDYSELLAARQERALQELDQRFESDRVLIIRSLLSAFAVDPANPTKQLSNAPKALELTQELQALEDYCSHKTQKSDLQEASVEALSYLCDEPLKERANLAERLRSLLSVAVEPVPTKTSKYGNVSYYPPSAQAAIACAILDQVIEEYRVPRAFEYDHLADLHPIVESRYAGPTEKHGKRSKAVLDAIKRIAGCDQSATARELSAKLRSLLGENHPYVPKRKTGHEDPALRQALGDLFEEMASIKATENLARFKEINKEYSSRQRNFHKARSNPFGLPMNPWGLSILSGFEEDHHLMLRTLLSLIQEGAITADDEVLVVGPRYVDELQFFRKYLGLPRTIGLDLFEDLEEGIYAGDMHETEFESGRFKLIYLAGTLAYAYDLRKVVAEFGRILKRPGFLCLLESGDRVRGVDPLGRSDPMSAEGLIGCFYKHRLVVHARDNGKSPVPNDFNNWPCVVLELQD